MVYLQQYAKSYTCLIERTVVISLSSGRNLGTVQRYLSSCYTEVAPNPDHITISDSLFPSSKGCCSVSLLFRWGHEEAHNSSVGHTYPSIVLSFGAILNF